MHAGPDRGGSQQLVVSVHAQHFIHDAPVPPVRGEVQSVLPFLHDETIRSLLHLVPATHLLAYARDIAGRGKTRF